jgi:hypothetical protein
MVVSHPGDCTQCADDDGKVCDRANNEGGVGIDRMVPEVVHDLEGKPPNSRKRTTAVDAS